MYTPENKIGFHSKDAMGGSMDVQRAVACVLHPGFSSRLRGNSERSPVRIPRTAVEISKEGHNSLSYLEVESGGERELETGRAWRTGEEIYHRETELRVFEGEDGYGQS